MSTLCIVWHAARRHNQSSPINEIVAYETLQKALWEQVHIDSMQPDILKNAFGLPQVKSEL
tara:strand:+ start:394 stop:576 length:183 start_codon:yes stop_codon:yes gene_type:complete